MDGFRETDKTKASKQPAEASRAVCHRQVYASMEVAENMVHKLKALGIRAHAERCPVCKLVHVWEVFEPPTER